MGKKIRHQFLLDAGTSERLNALARGPGATKTDVIAGAIKTFLERGSDSESTQISTQRLDRISRDVDAIRQEVKSLRREVETVREFPTRILTISMYFILSYDVLFRLYTPASIPKPGAHIEQRCLQED